MRHDRLQSVLTALFLGLAAAFVGGAVGGAGNVDECTWGLGDVPAQAGSTPRVVVYGGDLGDLVGSLVSGVVGVCPVSNCNTGNFDVGESHGEILQELGRRAC